MPIVVSDELERRSRELRAEVGQLANLMGRVRALGHVGRRAALKISVGEPRDLPEECRTQACFEPPSHPERHRRDGYLEQQEHPRQAHDRDHRGQALARERQVRAEIQKAPKEQRLHDDTGRREEQRARKNGGDSAPSARMSETRCLAGRTGASCSAATSSGARSASLRCRSSAGCTPSDGHEHRTTHEHMLTAVDRWRWSSPTSSRPARPRQDPPPPARASTPFRTCGRRRPG